MRQAGRGTHGDQVSARESLARARSVLNCLIFAITYCEDGDRELNAIVGDFAVAAEVIRDLLNSSIDRLDRLELGP